MSKTPLAGVAVAPAARTSLSRRIRAVLLAVATLVLAVVPGLSQTAAAAPAEKFSYTASAFGSSVTVSSVVKSGPSASVALGCTTEGDRHGENSSAGLNLGLLGRTGAVTTTVDSFASPVRAKATSTTAAVNLLGGLIRATAIKTVSTTTRIRGGYDISAEGTTLTGLVIAGRTIQADAAPNTRIDLAGFGYVIVNEQVRRSSGLTVNGLRLYINTRVNILNIPVGSNVIVSQAVSGLSVPVVSVLGGGAYGSYAKVGTAVVSGPTFKASMPCLGTRGELRSTDGAALTVPLVGSTGTVTNTVQGTVTATSANGEVTSTVQGARLLDGLVDASVIKAVAKASTDGETKTFSAEGSGFGSLTVAGRTNINANVAPNTKISIAGVGTLFLHRVIRTENSVQVIMVQLVLTSPVDGLPVGSDIRVGVASASIG